MPQVCKAYMMMFDDADRCLRGVPYAAVRDDAQRGVDRWPCFNADVPCPFRDGAPERLTVRFVDLKGEEVTA